MTIYPITPTTPACYGITCPRRKTCQRYDLVESTSLHETIANCKDGADSYPLFIQSQESPDARQ